MTKDEKMKWWNSLTLEEQKAHYELRIQEVKKAVCLLSNEKNRLEKILKDLLFQRDTVAHRITVTAENK